MEKLNSSRISPDSCRAGRLGGKAVDDDDDDGFFVSGLLFRSRILKKRKESLKQTFLERI